MELFRNLVNLHKTYQLTEQEMTEVQRTANYAAVPAWLPPIPGSFSDDHTAPESNLCPQPNARKKKRTHSDQPGPKLKRRKLENTIPTTQSNEPLWKEEFGIHPSLESKPDFLPEPTRWVAAQNLSDEVFERRLKRNVPPRPSFVPSRPGAARVKIAPRKRKMVEVEEDECEETREAFWRYYIQQLVDAEEDREKPKKPEQQEEQADERQSLIPLSPDLHNYTTPSPTPSANQSQTPAKVALVISTNPHTDRDMINFDDGEWELNISISPRYHIRSAVQLPDSNAPQNLSAGSKITFSFELQEDYDWDYNPDVGDADDDVKISFVRTPNGLISKISTMMLRPTHLAPDDPDDIKTLQVTLSTGDNNAFSTVEYTPYIFSFNVETLVVAHQASFVCATSLVFSREAPQGREEALQMLYQLDQLWHDDAKYKTVIEDLAKFEEDYIQGDVGGIRWHRVAAMVSQ